MDDAKLSPKTLAEQAVGREMVERKALLDAAARATRAQAEQPPAPPPEPTVKASKKKS